MAVVLLLIAAVVLASAYYVLRSSKSAAKVKIDENGWFGEGERREDDASLKPFALYVQEGVLEDLKRRLEQARFGHDVLDGADNFEYGFNVGYLKEVRDYWLHTFDWNKQLELLNKYPQFTTEIEGLQVHFYHVKPDPTKYKKIVPILIVHGWPGCVFEFHKLTPLLLDPKDHQQDGDFAFELIIPSIPGYGFSSQPRKTGFSQAAAARVFHKLMQRIGHNKHYLQGGDWGAIIVSNYARLYPENVIGLHLNMFGIIPSGSKWGTLQLILGSFFPKYFFKNARHHEYSLFGHLKDIIRESGYMHIQATRPDTVGTALNDSPIGLAAYILEKFSVWTNPNWRSLHDGGLTKKFTLDELLTIITIYWTQGNIVSSQRLYKEFYNDPNVGKLSKQFITVPTLHFQFNNELFDRAPEEVLRTAVNLHRQETVDDGGHFAAFEEPHALSRSIFNFVRELERLR